MSEDRLEDAEQRHLRDEIEHPQEYQTFQDVLPQRCTCQQPAIPLAVHRMSCRCHDCQTGTTVPLEKAEGAHVLSMLRGQIGDDTDATFSIYTEYSVTPGRQYAEMTTCLIRAYERDLHWDLGLRAISLEILLSSPL